MQKLFAIALFVAVFSSSHSYFVNREEEYEDEDIYLKIISESLAPFLKPIFDQWAKYESFEMGPMSILDPMSDGFVQGEVASPAPPNVLESLQKHMDQFKTCLDQALAKTVDEVNVKQVQPIFDVLGDQVNRFSKAFEDLTATKGPA